MSVYFIGMILSAILGYIYSKFLNNEISNKLIFSDKKKNKIKLLRILPIIPLTAIAGIRYGVGQDYFYTYVPIFNKVLTGNTSDVWGDYGFILLNKFVQLFTNDYAGIFILTAIIFHICIYLSIYENSKDVSFSIILLVCTGYYFCFLNGIRQMLTAAIFMYSIKYIKNNKFMHYLFLIILSSFIHLSALIYIPVFFLRNVYFRKIKMILIIIVAFAGKGLISKVMLKVISYTKYSWYLDSTYNSERQGYIVILINIFVLVFAYLYIHHDAKEFNLFINLQLLTVITSAFIGIIPVAERLLWNFGIASIILIPNAVNREKNPKIRFCLKIGIIFMYLIYFYYTIGVKNNNNVLPYKTIFMR